MAVRAFALGLALLCAALPAAPALAAAPATPGPAQTQAAAEAELRALIARWYEELAKEKEGRYWSLFAPGHIDASPPISHRNTGSRALGPPIYESLAASALRFSYDVDQLRIDPNFAKAWIWERGFFYAAAAQKTYERGARTLFLFERQADGKWLILAHESHSEGIPPNKVTDPLPDLRALYYATDGKHRDPEKDAAEAAKF